MRSQGIAALVGVAACYQPSVPEGAPCSADTACPVPLVCDRGSCRHTPGPTDGPPGDVPIDSPGDAPVDGPPPGCTSTPVTTPFPGGTMVITLASPVLDGNPFLSADRLEIYFKSERPGGAGLSDLWRATRATTSSPWSAPVPVTELNTADEEGSPKLSPDRLQIWFASDRPGGMGDFDIYTATRASTSAAWSAPVRVAEVSSAAYEEGFYVLPSLLVAYLHSERDTPGSAKLYRTSRASPSSPWSTPVAVGAPFTGGNYENPWLTPDDCVMYFQSTRAGGLGMADLYYASRTTPTGAWSAPVHLTTLSTAGYDADPWLSADQRYIMYASGPNLTGLELTEAAR